MTPSRKPGLDKSLRESGVGSVGCCEKKFGRDLGRKQPWQKVFQKQPTLPTPDSHKLLSVKVLRLEINCHQPPPYLPFDNVWFVSGDQAHAPVWELSKAIAVWSRDPGHFATAGPGRFVGCSGPRQRSQRNLQFFAEQVSFAGSRRLSRLNGRTCGNDHLVRANCGQPSRWCFRSGLLRWLVGDRCCSRVVGGSSFECIEPTPIEPLSSSRAFSLGG